MDVSHDDGRFHLGDDAELLYRREGDRVIATHTEVGASLRGTGAGRKLVDALVDWARAEKLSIVPRCPFVRATFDKDPSLHDVLASDPPA